MKPGQAVRFSSLPKVRTPEDYQNLTEAQKTELRALQKKYLISDTRLQQGIQAIIPLAREFSVRYPESRYQLVGFGRSPLLFLEVLNGLEKNARPSTALAGTHFISLHHDLNRMQLMDRLGSLLCEHEPVTDRRQRDAYDTRENQLHLYLKNYQAYLKQKNLDPEAILTAAHQGWKTIIFDRVESGLSIEMLARILYQWAKGQGQEKALVEAVQFYLFPTSASKTYENALNQVKAMGFKIDFPSHSVGYEMFAGAQALGVKFNYDDHDMLCHVIHREELLADAEDANAVRFAVLDSLYRPPSDS